MNLIAEIDNGRADFDDNEFMSVTLGEVGYAQCALIYKKEWAAFKQLVAEIDAEWAI